MADLTPDEAASELGTTRLRLMRMVRRHKIPVLWHSNREARFDPIAMQAVRDTIRHDGDCAAMQSRLNSPIGPWFDLTIGDVVTKSSGWEVIAGVYFLIRDGVVVYVGQSINVFQRLDEHRKKKQFDRFYVLPCPAERLREVEMHYIKTFAPELNFETKPPPLTPEQIAAIVEAEQHA